MLRTIGGLAAAPLNAIVGALARLGGDNTSGHQAGASAHSPVVEKFIQEKLVDAWLNKTVLGPLPKGTRDTTVTLHGGGQHVAAEGMEDVCTWSVGCFGMKGQPSKAEDAAYFLDLTTLPGFDDVGRALLAVVLDGHGGSEAVRYSAEHFARHALADPCALRDEPCKVMRRAILAVDSELVAAGVDSGAVMCAVLIIDDGVFVANCGDCRAIAYDVSQNHDKEKNNVARLTFDHNLHNEAEVQRVRDLGAEVQYRIEGMCSSPSLGAAAAGSAGTAPDPNAAASPFAAAAASNGFSLPMPAHSRSGSRDVDSDDASAGGPGGGTPRYVPEYLVLPVAGGGAPKQLAVTRALGHSDVKRLQQQQLAEAAAAAGGGAADTPQLSVVLTAEPEVHEFVIAPKDLLVIGCDGLFEKMNDREVGLRARNLLTTAEGDPDCAFLAARGLCRGAYQLQSHDNISVLVIKSGTQRYAMRRSNSRLGLNRASSGGLPQEWDIVPPVELPGAAAAVAGSEQGDVLGAAVTSSCWVCGRDHWIV